MNPYSGMNDNKKDNNNRTGKSIAAIPLAGIVIAAGFLSGLSLINGYQPAIAQQNITGNAATANVTTTGGGGGTSARSACAPTQTGGGGSQNATTTNATTITTMGGGNANATTGNATTTATNATTSAVGGGNQSTSEVREYIEAACMAAQNNDTQGVLLQLNLALNELGGNMTTSADGEDEGEDSGGDDGEDEGEAEG
ncbi:MAG TPA: hypothetical protein VI037_05905 [Nitrososphaera sp.]